jgi:hypothetical protein
VLLSLQLTGCWLLAAVVVAGSSFVTAPLAGSVLCQVQGELGEGGQPALSMATG